MTPQQFAEKYITVPIDDYVCLVHDPRPTSPVGKTFTVECLGNVEGGTIVKYLNVDIDLMKQIAMETIVDEICEAIEGPVSAEVTATDAEAMIAEGLELAAISGNIAVKVPLTWDGLQACKVLRANGTMVNVTLCFAPAQALLAAKASANFISPFIGRLDDISQDGMQLIRDIVQIYRQYPHTVNTNVLVASIRHPLHVVEAAKIGADVVTIPPGTLRQLFKHPLTDKGLAAFTNDWAGTGQSIL